MCVLNVCWTDERKREREEEEFIKVALLSFFHPRSQDGVESVYVRKEASGRETAKNREMSEL